MTTTIVIRRIANGFVVQHLAHAYPDPANETYFATEADLIAGMSDVTSSALRCAERERERDAGPELVGGQVPDLDILRANQRIVRRS